MNKPAASTLFTVLLLVVQGTVHLVAAQPAKTPPPQTPSSGALIAAAAKDSDPLSKLNGEFLKFYAGARSYEVNHCGPVIIVSNGKATLIAGKNRTEAKFIPSQYQILKEVDHTTLAVFVALNQHTENKLSAVNLAHLELLRQYMRSAEAQVNHLHLDQATIARQQKLLHNTESFINNVLTKGSVSKEELDSFVRAQTPQLMENANAAVTMELASLDKHIQAWKQLMTPTQWSKLHVVICDEHMPRQDEHYMQYFLKLFGETQEGQHVIYQEGNFNEAKALQLLGTHLLDTSIAKAFFGDPGRMHRDLLSDGAHKYLEEHAAP